MVKVNLTFKDKTTPAVEDIIALAVIKYIRSYGWKIESVTISATA